MVVEIDVDEFKEKIDSNENFILVDVRFEEELKFGKINSDQIWIPLDEFSERFKELDKTKEIILYCRSGGRSYGAADFLIRKGFSKVTNLKGGILAWRKFDSSIEYY
jgi:rhodanese-related sulfurtransferase